MSRRAVALAWSALGWLGFNVVMIWAVLFLAGVWLPRTVDAPARVHPLPALATDLALLLLFAVQHSVMARRSAKAWLRRWVPPELERTAFVVATDICLALLFTLWQPFGGRVWSVDGGGGVGLWVLCGAGWALAVASTYAVDHAELFGLRQAGWLPPRSHGPGLALKVTGLHALVRHPLMTGLVLAFWVTPTMTASHLLFAAAATGYVLVGVGFEERDLRRAFGSAYDDYAARVPALVPVPRAWFRAGP
ncbi:MAG: isoprenylcysteine carboxylmethyltransferase family protein [Nocardioidaceae bacterium]